MKINPLLAPQVQCDGWYLDKWWKGKWKRKGGSSTGWRRAWVEHRGRKSALQSKSINRKIGGWWKKRRHGDKELTLTGGNSAYALHLESRQRCMTRVKMEPQLLAGEMEELDWDRRRPWWGGHTVGICDVDVDANRISCKNRRIGLSQWHSKGRRSFFEKIGEAGKGMGATHSESPDVHGE